MLISSALAQDAGPVAPPPDVLTTLMPLVLIFVVMYFILIRPQQSKAKKLKAMLVGMRRGDVVVTGGGVFGKISKIIDDETVEVEIADNVRIKVLRVTILEVRSKPEPASDKKDGGAEVEAKKGGLMSMLKK